MKQAIILTVGTVDFSFNVTVQDHSDFVDAAARGESITAASHNFLTRTVDTKNKEDLKKLFSESPGAEYQIAQHVKAEFAPVLAIKVKK